MLSSTREWADIQAGIWYYPSHAGCSKGYTRPSEACTEMLKRSTCTGPKICVSLLQMWWKPFTHQVCFSLSYGTRCCYQLDHSQRLWLQIPNTFLFDDWEIRFSYVVPLAHIWQSTYTKMTTIVVSVGIHKEDLLMEIDGGVNKSILTESTSQSYCHCFLYLH